VPTCKIKSDNERQLLVVSKRIHVTIPDYIYETLEQWADNEGRPRASLAAFLIEVAVLEAQKTGQIPPKPEKPDKGK